MSPDLSGLNDTERRILRLLAEGHTAKSAAAATGISLHGINERLREARRKSGAGSSRELARALAAAEAPPAEKRAQENRDKKFDLPAPPPDRADGEAPAPPPRRRYAREITVMSIAATAAAALGILAIASGMHGSTRAPSAPTAEASRAGPPRVIATSPANGATVPAGALFLSVTFDRPMRPDSYSFVIIDGVATPDCASAPTVSADRRSFTLACTVAPGRSYAIGFNGGRFRNFMGADGVPATPAILRFATR